MYVSGPGVYVHSKTQLKVTLAARWRGVTPEVNV